MESNNLSNNNTSHNCQVSKEKKYVDVALKLPTNNGIFTYELLDDIKDPFGFRVMVPFKNKLMLGVIINQLPTDYKPKFSIRAINQVLDSFATITKAQKDLIEFSAQYYCNPLGIAYHKAIIKNLAQSKSKNKIKNITQEHYILNPEQEKLVNKIKENPKKAFLLQGVTGSGKTLVYLEIAKQVLQNNQSVLFLVPEIALTKGLINRVESYLGLSAAIIHSNVSLAKVRDEYLSLLKQEKRILIGVRSAIFAPLPDLGLIIVDEEHDQSFKQEESPRYNAKDLALWRAKNENATIILSSATPSLESIYNVANNKLLYLVLSKRHNKTSLLPDIEIVDLRQEKKEYTLTDNKQQKMCIISDELFKNMQESLSNNEQILLFLNQRGYAKFGLCNACGHAITCINCSVTLTYYEKRQMLCCHHCDYSERLSLTCKNCLQEEIIFLGLGTERVQKHVQKIFPQFRIERLDRDVITNDKQLNNILTLMHEKKIDILIGTQMVAKGHDFSNLSLVGVICADTGLYMADFRAAEKTFQTLVQVAGRCGRAETKGKVIIQTFNPKNEILNYIKNHDVDGFIAHETAQRKINNFPPFSKSCIIRCEHTNKDTALFVIEKIKPLIKNYLSKIEFLGPHECSIEKINHRFRYQCFFMTPTISMMSNILNVINTSQILQNLIDKYKVRFIIDRDPYQV